MERCPCCKARLNNAVLCPRCQADVSNVVYAEQAACYWLSEAIRHWSNGNAEQSLRVLELSIGLKNSVFSLIFRDYLIHSQSRLILNLLVEQQLLAAKRQLFRVRRLLPDSSLLQQLNSFSDYLLAQQPCSTALNERQALDQFFEDTEIKESPDAF